jgi:putative ABC transport system substrate-binding protein
MERRSFVALAGGAFALQLLALGHPARARSGRLRRIGIIRTSNSYPDRYAALAEGLRDLGWAEGRNLEIEWRDTDGDNALAKEMAASLVAARVELIVTNANHTVDLARSVTSSVPIVAAAFGTPVESGFAKSLARPGGNITGVSLVYDGIADKQFELAMQALGAPKRFAFLSNPAFSSTVRVGEDWKALAKKHGVTMLDYWPNTLPELEVALESIERAGIEALLVVVQPLFLTHRRPIAERMRAARVATFGSSAEFVDGGFLASYGPDFRAAFRAAARYVDRILKGASPAELPIEQLTKLELAVNQTTAKAIGIAIPRQVLLRADRVVD